VHTLPLLILAAAEAEEKAPPLIDIDATVFIQFVIFLATLALLRSVLFKPYLALRAEREDRIDGERRRAKEMESRAGERLKDYEARLQRAKQLGADERVKRREEATRREREILDGARAEAQKHIDAAAATLATQRDAARQGLLAQSRTVGRQVAAKILGREVI
jgi:F-type H+-transporting ATPase subunit b